MFSREGFKQSIFEHAQDNFRDLALNLYDYQKVANPVYKQYIDLLPKREVKSLEDIPFLPVQFFKSHRILCEGVKESVVFESSGTSGQIASKHFVADTDLYEHSFRSSFERIYGNPSSYTFLALLPSYLERQNASLVYMASQFIESSEDERSGFYLDEFEQLVGLLEKLEGEAKKTILLGVTFALLDFAKQYPIKLNNTIVMETGGMKGRGKELTREEVHQELMKGFCVDQIHAEYGMTELLSQAWSEGNGIFQPAPWMKVLIRQPRDPFSCTTIPSKGAINIIDLANIDSCAFIATDDLGELIDGKHFKVLGRMDQSELRGCNLMLS